MNAYPEHEHEQHRSIAELVRELRDETMTLLRQEVALARTELTEKVSAMGKSAALLAAGALVAYAGACLVIYALALLTSWLLARMGVSDWVAAFLGPAIIGLIVAGVGWALIQSNLRHLKQGSLRPDKTIESVKEEKQWIQQKLQRA